MLGKEGPCYLEHGIVAASNKDASFDAKRLSLGSPVVIPGTVGSVNVDVTGGDLLRIPIGENGKKVTMDDVVAAFDKVSTHKELVKFRKSGRSYFHEGFKVSQDGKTITMLWGS